MAHMVDMGLRCSPRSHGVTHLVQDPSGAGAQLPSIRSIPAPMTVLQKLAMARSAFAALNKVARVTTIVKCKTGVNLTPELLIDVFCVAGACGNGD